MVAEQTETAPRTLPRLDAFYWAGALIWVGLVFGAESLGILPQIGGAEPWSWVFIGGGLGGIALSFYALSTPTIADPTIWDWIWAVIFLVLGTAGFLSISIPWWLILIVVGTAFLYLAFQRQE